MQLSFSRASASKQKETQISRWRTLFRWCAAHQQLVFGILSGAWALGLYWRALTAPFVYDDLDQIVKNPELASFHDTVRLFFLAPSAFTSHFRGVGGSNYRPLFWLSLSIDRQIWGLHGAGGFHFTSILLHWADGFLFYIFLRRVGIRFTTAASAVLVWLGMPINSEAVAWVSGRSYVLCGLFLLLALISAHSYFVREKTSSLIAVLVASIAALLSHESGILFLPLAALLAYGMGRIAKRSAWVVFAVAAGADLVFLLARMSVGARAGGGGPSPWAIGSAFWKYCLWIVAPIHMSMQRATSMPPNVPSLTAIAAMCAVAALCVTIFMIRKTAPILAAGLAWSIIAILPFCGIVFIYQGMAERYDYLASAGIAIAISALVLQYSGVLKGALVCLMAVWITWGAWRLTARVLDWCDPVALYQHSLEATADAILFYDLGWAWRERGDNAKALMEYQEAARRKPDYEEAHASIGQIFSILGQPAQAIPAYNRALALVPEDSNTRVDLAVTLEQLGDHEGAEGEFKKALGFAPKNISALNDLGSLLILEGKLDEAVPYFEQAIQANPFDKNAYYSLGGISQQRGQMDRALMYYRKVLQIDPNDQDTLANVARLYGQPR